MRVLDLYAGKKGFSRAFSERGHEVVSIEYDKAFPDITIYADVLELKTSELPGPFDVILSGTPCNSFSLLRIGRNWTMDNDAKTRSAILGISCAFKTLDIVKYWKPMCWLAENPVGKLRKMGIFDGFERRTITQCQYGKPCRKPTDLFGVFPKHLELRPMCKNGDSCHIAAPRGSRTGVQGGMSSADSAEIPYELSLDICIACEKQMEG